MKIWCISDTHNKHGLLDLYDPKDVDVLIHAGDESLHRSPIINNNEVLDFIEWLKAMPYKHKIWIAGNHSTSIGERMIEPLKMNLKRFDIHYLENSGVEIDGVKFWGSPVTPSFGIGWAFNRGRDKIHKTWNMIPEDTDVLITHGPPYGRLDFARESEPRGRLVGCKNLAKRILEIQPKYHIFGHIHEDAGKVLNVSGETTTYINACVLNLDYDIINNGTIIEI